MNAAEDRATAPAAFEERQPFPAWLGSALIALAVPALLIAIVAVVETEGLTLEAAGIVALIGLAVLGPIPLLRRSELHTTVRDDGVYFRFSPYHRTDRRVPFDEIEDVRRNERRAYQYGLRRTRWGWEYRPNSSEGIEIYRESGPSIFLGSDRPHELREAIDGGMRRG